MSAKKLSRLSDLMPDPQNANKGTERGGAMLERSLRDYGAGRSILVDRDGVVIAGNKTLEQAAALDLPINVVQSDGRSLVVVQRTDVSMTDDRGRSLALADNKVGSVNLDWDANELAAAFADGASAKAFWTERELAAVFAPPDDFRPDIAPPGADAAPEQTPTTCPECGHVF